MSDTQNHLLTAAFTFFSFVALIGAWTMLGHSRAEDFDRNPPQETTWQATIATSQNHALPPGTPCTVRLRTAQRCRYSCYTKGKLVATCGGDRVLEFGPAADMDRWGDLGLGSGQRMMWKPGAGTLVLEDASTLEPWRLGIELDPATRDTVVDPSCRTTWVEVLAVDTTPECAMTYLEQMR